MSDSEIKVTDKRLFTPDGSLREEYRHLESAEPSESTQVPDPQPAAPQAQEGVPPAGEPEPSSPAPGPETDASETRARLEVPGTPEGLGAPTILDLIGVLAEPTLVFLGDAKLPDGSTQENLEMARLYIDLLDVLRQKTVGNLSARESMFLEDLLSQLRLRYVQKRD